MSTATYKTVDQSKIETTAPAPLRRCCLHPPLLPCDRVVRDEANKGKPTISFDEVLNELDITKDELDAMPDVELA